MLRINKALSSLVVLILCIFQFCQTVSKNMTKLFFRFLLLFHVWGRAEWGISYRAKDNHSLTVQCVGS